MSALRRCKVRPSIRHVTVVSCLVGRQARPATSRICITLSRSVPALSGAAMCGALHLFARDKTIRVLAVSREGIYFSNSSSPRTRFVYEQYKGLVSIRVSRALLGMPSNRRSFEVSRARVCCGNMYDTYIRIRWLRVAVLLVRWGRGHCRGRVYLRDV